MQVQRVSANHKQSHDHPPKVLENATIYYNFTFFILFGIMHNILYYTFSVTIIIILDKLKYSLILLAYFLPSPFYPDKLGGQIFLYFKS